MDLGSQSCPREVLLGGLSVQKPKKNQWFFKVFEKAAFWFFLASDCSFGFVLAVSCAILVSEGVPIRVTKVKKNGLKFNYGPMKSFTITFMLSYFLLFF